MKSSKTIVNDYLSNGTWRIKENSTVHYSIGGLILYNNGVVTSDYWLHNIYDEEIANAHIDGAIHIHDLSMLSGYCAGWSLKQLIQEGLGGVPGKITSSPANHLSTLCNQMVNFLGIMQNEWAGAQAFSSFDTYLAPFVKVDNLSYKEVKQCIQSLVFGLNTPSRWGTQAPFTNITLDWTVPDDLAELNCIVGGKETNFRYKDCKKEMDMVNKAFIEVMIEGDANGRGFQYPIPTYSITKDFDWSETENNKLLFEMTAKYGIPYFSNYVNSDMSPSDIRSMCILPDSLVWVKLNNCTKHITIAELYDCCDKFNDVKILTRYGYRPIKEVQRFKYEGKMVQITTETGKTISTTLDHEHVVYSNTGEVWCTNGSSKKLFPIYNIPTGWKVIDSKYNTSALIKKKASELCVGEYLSCRNPNAGESRKGLTYVEVYGEEKAKELSTALSIQHKGREAWNKGVPPTLEVRQKISNGLKGHYVSESCKQKSSLRWKAKNNPRYKGGSYHEGRINVSISPYEHEFKNELEALGIDFIHQYIIKADSRDYVVDFYIPNKNLIVELETNYAYDECMYNNFDNIVKDGLQERYNELKAMGYNVLVFNPKRDNSSYRKYINSTEQIISIVPFDYNDYVYDLEVDCDDIEGDTTMYHTFYANEILTGNCCRLRLDLRELRKKSGGFFGSGENTGSIGVVTINMPRIAYLSNNKEDFFNRLTKLMDIAARSLDIKRKTITQYLKDGLYPYTKRYLGDFHNHFSTIGLVGMNEACLNASWIYKDLTHKKAQEFTIEVLNFMRNKLSDYQELYGDLFNLEATPAESTAYRLAKHDKEKYPDIITAASEGASPYYTNSSHLPVGFTEDIFAALDIQDEFQTLYTSGTVFHAFLGEKLPDWKAAANLVRKISENYKLPYYTMSPTYSICTEHGYITGEHYNCPICGKVTEVYSRITGYYRPIQNWNVGKAQEFIDRKEYVIADTKPVTESVSDSSCAKCVICNYKDDDIIFDDIIIERNVNTSPILVATKTCPNCRIAAQMLDKANITYTKIFVEDNKEFVESLDIRQAPTLIVGSNEKITNVSNIRKWIESR